MSAAPSIGSIGSIVFDSHNDRSKGVITEIFDSDRLLHWRLRQLCEEHTYGSRLQIHTFVTKDVQPDVQNIHWGGFNLSLEAFIPIHGHPRIAGVAYYGANNARRVVSDRVKSEEERLYLQVMKRPFRPLPDVTVEELKAGHVRRGDISDLVTIYRSGYSNYHIDFTEQSVRSIVENSMVLVVREGTTIVSACVVEMVEIPFLNTLPLRLANITNAVTRRDCRDRGYYSATKRTAILHLRFGGDPIPTVITTEARANSGRVLRSNMRLGMVYAGYEPMDSVISSSNDEEVSQDNRFANLIVFYAP